ncbi:MAG TPA: helix-turn-helix domain-containing protein [Chloroflexaceae bacterium]|nr:helix-turn-helix domain-containing protein [Chloroflexaceae bacterium]
MDDLSSFGAWLRRRRRARDLTQAGLASLVGCAPGTVRKLEDDERRPSPELVARLADALALAPEHRPVFLKVARGLLPASRLLDLAPQAPPASPPLLVLPPPPHPLLPLIGREQELGRVSRLLVSSSSRLITLTGAGGVGKTRLALACAWRTAPAFAGRVAWVDLVSVRDPALLVDTLAQALCPAPSPARPALVELARALGDAPCLLVLDNFEHLAHAAPALADLLASCPRLTLLVTSRAALRVRGERIVRLEPLALPQSLVEEEQLDALAAVPAVALFLERARALDEQFVLDAGNGATVAAVCRSLDGLPLALELAAARLGLFSARQLLMLLERPLAALDRGPRDLPERQRSLRDTLDWSYGLLTEGEQALFARLGVFVGDALIELICLVCAAGGEDPLTITGQLDGLVNQSLVQARRDGDAPRFRMLETIRVYAQERLAGRGEAAELRRRHALAYCELAERADAQINTPAALVWLKTLEREHGNLRVALEWAFSPEGDLVVAARLAGALRFFWRRQGHWTEGRRWLAQARAAVERTAPAEAAPLAHTLPWAIWHKLMQGEIMLAVSQCDPQRALELSAMYVERSRAEGGPLALAVALDLRAAALNYAGSYGAATAIWREAVELARALNEPRALAQIIDQWGIRALENGDNALAEELYAEHLTLARALDDPQLVARASVQLAWVALRWGRHRTAGELAREAVERFAQLGDAQQLTEAHQVSAQVALAEGDARGALGHIEACLELWRELGRTDGIGFALDDRARVCTLLGEHTRALADFAASVSSMRSLNDRVGLIYRLEGLAELWAARGDARRTARLCAAVEALFAAESVALNARYRPGFERAVVWASQALGEEGFAAAWAAGAALTLDQALDEALDEAKPA